MATGCADAASGPYAVWKATKEKEVSESDTKISDIDTAIKPIKKAIDDLPQTNSNHLKKRRDELVQRRDVLVRNKDGALAVKKAAKSQLATLNTPQKYFCSVIKAEVKAGGGAWSWFKNQKTKSNTGIQYWQYTKTYNKVDYVIVGHIHGNYPTNEQGVLQDWEYRRGGQPTANKGTSAYDKYEVQASGAGVRATDPCGCGKEELNGQQINVRCETQLHGAIADGLATIPGYMAGVGFPKAHNEYKNILNVDNEIDNQFDYGIVGGYDYGGEYNYGGYDQLNLESNGLLLMNILAVAVLFLCLTCLSSIFCGFMGFVFGEKMDEVHSTDCSNRQQII